MLYYNMLYYNMHIIQLGSWISVIYIFSHY